MAASFTRIIKGLEIYDRDGSGEIIDILAGAGDPNGSITAPRGSLFIDATNSIQYINTDDGTTWQAFSTGGGSAAEEGWLRGFVGKSGAGEEYPEYTSNNVVISDTTGSAGDGQNLEQAIGALDAEIGAAVTPETRTNFPTSDQAINLNIDALDAAIGNDSQLTTTNYIALANTIYQNLAALDAQLNVVSGGLRWIDAMDVVTATDLTAQSGLSVTWVDDNGGAPTLTGGERIYSTFDNKWYTADAGAWGAGNTVLTGDQFFTSVNLLDPNNQEQGAAFSYNGSSTVKTADFDFELATTVNLSSGYTAAGGTVAASDTVETAIAKLDDNQQDLNTLSGEGQGATDHGTFTGDIIQDNRNTHQALQDLETAIENEQEPETTTTGVGGTPTTVGSVLVDEVDYAVWLVYAEGITDRSKKYASRISAIHNGTPLADATNGTAGVDSDQNLFLEFNANKIAGITFDVVCTGAGGTQTMELQASCTEAGGMDVTVRRIAGLDVA
jgi:hypothetical protein